MNDSIDLFESIFDELPKESLQEFGTRADHAVSSIINLLDDIQSNFNDEQAKDLTKRLFLSIKNRDARKFRTGLEKISLEENKK